MKFTSPDPTAERLDRIEEMYAELVDRLECPRCSTEPPPVERWPGDARSRDYRKPHTCGKARQAS